MYNSEIQKKNLCWVLPRPKPDHYPGGMPLYAEQWCLQLAKDLLKNQDAIILNLFCGMNTEGYRVDIRSEVKPDLCCDVHHLTKYLDQKFDIIFADPPYSTQESKQLYGTTAIHYKQWSAEAVKLLSDNGILIVYHKLVPINPCPELLSVVQRVCIINRPNHSPRVAIYFQRRPTCSRSTCS